MGPRTYHLRDALVRYRGASEVEGVVTKVDVSMESQDVFPMGDGYPQRVHVRTHVKLEVELIGDLSNIPYDLFTGETVTCTIKGPPPPEPEPLRNVTPAKPLALGDDPLTGDGLKS